MGNPPLIFSDDEEMADDEMDDFIDDSDQHREGVSFYRQLESPNRTRDP